MRLNKSGLRTSRIIFAASAAALMASNSYAANTFTWVGTAGDNNWLTATNWSDTSSTTAGPPAASNSDVALIGSASTSSTVYANTTIGSGATAPTINLASTSSLYFSDFFGGSSNLTNGVASNGNPLNSSANTLVWQTFSATAAQPGAGFQISGTVTDASQNADDVLDIAGQTSTNLSFNGTSSVAIAPGVLINAGGVLQNTGLGVLRLGATNIDDNGTISAAAGTTISLGNSNTTDQLFSDAGQNGQLNIAAGATATSTDVNQSFILGGIANNSLVTNNNGTFNVSLNNTTSRGGVAKALEIDGGTFNNNGTFNETLNVTRSNFQENSQNVQVFIGTGLVNTAGFIDAGTNVTTFNNTGTVNVINNESDPNYISGSSDYVAMYLGRNINFSNAGNFNIISNAVEPLSIGQAFAISFTGTPTGSVSGTDILDASYAGVTSRNNFTNAGGNVVINGKGAVLAMTYLNDTAPTVSYVQSSGTTTIENGAALTTPGWGTNGAGGSIPGNTNMLGSVLVNGGTFNLNSGGYLVTPMLGISGASTVVNVGNGGVIAGAASSFHYYFTTFDTTINVTNGATLNLQSGSFIPANFSNFIGTDIGGVVLNTDANVNIGNANETFLGLSSVATNTGVVNLSGTALTITGVVPGYDNNATANAPTTAGTGAGTINNVLSETYNGKITGTGSFTVSGGTLTLGGASTYNGTTTINSNYFGGTVLELSSTGSLASTSLSMGGGTLKIDAGQAGQNFSSGTALTAGANFISASGLTNTLALGAINRSVGSTIDFGTLPTGGGAITTATANANPAGGQQTILGGYATVGGNTWAVSGSGATPGAISGLATYSSTFASAADVDAPSGALAPGAMTINSLRFNNGGSSVDATGGLTVATGGILVTPSGGTVSINNGTLTTNANQDVVVIQNNTTNAATIGSIITGANVGLTKSGAGDLIVSGANTYGGPTNLAQGTLDVAGSGQLSNTVNVSNGTVLNIDNGANLTASTNINATGAVQIFGQNNASFTAVVSGAPVINFLGSNFNNTTVQTIGQLNGSAIVNINSYANGATQLGDNYGVTLKIMGGGTFSGVFQDDVPTQAGGGDTIEIGGTAPLILTGTSGIQPGANTRGPNSFGGVVQIDSGATLQVGNGGASGSFPLLQGGTVGGSTGSSYVQVNGGTINFDTGQRYSAYQNGYVTNGNSWPNITTIIQGTGHIIQSGAGSTELSANLSNYSGDFTISAGALWLNQTNSAFLPQYNANGIVDNAELNISSSGVAGGLPIVDSISGSGDVAITGNVGTNTPVIFNANNTYAGATYLGGSTAGVTSGTSYLRIGSGGTVGSLGLGNVYLDQQSEAVYFDRSDTITVANKIVGAGSIGIIGHGGTVIITSNNPNAGGGTVANGATLQVGNGGTTGALGNYDPTLLANNITAGAFTSAQPASTVGGEIVTGAGTIAFDRSDTDYVSNPFNGTIVNNGNTSFPTGSAFPTQGTLSLTQMGTGTVILTSNSTYIGATNILSGTVQLGNYTASGSLGANANAVGGAINDSTALVFARTDTALAITGAIGGSGTVTQIANGTTTLDLQNTYSGATTIDAGGINEAFSAIAPAGASGNQSLSNFINPNSTLVLAGGKLTVTGRANSTTTSVTAIASSGATNGSGSFAANVSEVVVGSTAGLEPGQIISDTNNDFSAGTYIVSVLNGTMFTISSPTLAASVASVPLTFTAVTNTASQTFNNVTVNAGQSNITATSAGGGTAITLGTITRNAGGLVDFNLPSGVQGVANQITTSTANAYPTGGSPTILGGWATITGYGGWAVSGSGATAGQISALATYASAYTAGADVSTAAGTYTPGSISLNSLRFNAAGAYTLNGSADTLTIASGGILETSAVGANQVVFNEANLATGNGQDLILLNNDTNALGFMTVNSAISGGIGLTKGAAGTVYLNGNNSYTGPTTIGAGTLVVGDFGATGSLGSNASGILDDGALAVNRTNSFSIANNISGYGAFAQVGTGTTTLSGTETYLGATTLTAGTLVLASTASVNPLSALTLGGGTLSIAARNSSLTFGNIAFVTQASGFGGTTTIAAGLSIVDASAGLGSGNTLALNNIERSTGGVVNFNLPTDGSSITTTSYNVNSVLGGWATVGGNTWAVSAAANNLSGAISGLASYTGSFTANANVDAPTGSSTPGALTVNTLRFNSAGSYSVGANASDPLVVSTGGILETANVGNNPVVINSSVLSSGNEQDLVVIQNNTAAPMTINSVINNSGNVSTTAGGGIALTKAGNGALILNGTNTYTGGTFIDDAGSTIDISADANLGAAAGAVTYSGGTLEDTNTGSVSTARNMTFNPGGASIGVAGGGTLIAGGVMSGASTLTKVDNGTLILTGANTYIGPTTISAGALQVGNGAAAGSLGVYAGAITDNGNLAYKLTTATLTVANPIVGTGSLSQLGTNSLVLSGANTYSSGTTISAGGTVVASTVGSLPTGGAISNSGALLVNANNTPGAINGAGTITVAPSTTLSLSTGSGGSSTTLLTLGTLSTLNLNNNHLFINYGSGTDPISSISALIASGYNGGTWTGSGITSAAAAANAGSYGIGYADSADLNNPAGLSSGQIEIAYTLLGDANLDYKVNGTDFTLMATNFNDAVTNGWDEGDFNYSNTVNGSDFLLLANNFNQFAAQSAVTAADLQALDSFAAANGISLASVPEPASLGLLALGTIGVLSRRRRKH